MRAATAAEKPVKAEEQQYSADDGADDAAQVEHVAVADAEETGEDPPADPRARQADAERHQPAQRTFHALEWVLHERAGQRAGQKTKDDGTDHIKSLPRILIG